MFGLSSVLTFLKQRPALLNGATGCVLFAGSDAIAQELEIHGFSRTFPSLLDNTLSHPADSGSQDFLVLRFATTGLLGIFFGGFFYPRAYAALDRTWPGTQLRHVLTKSVVEIFSVGIFVNSVSMGLRGLLVGRATSDVKDHLIQEMPSVTLNDVRVWLPYNIVAFGFIPAYIRPTTTAMMESAWQTYISLHSHNYTGRDAASNGVNASSNCRAYLT